MVLRLRRHFGIPGILAVFALVFAMFGGAYAAKKQGFVITKLSQIKPSVRNQLKGKQGAQGAPGTRGLEGARGLQGTSGSSGAPGSPWTAGGVLPTGATLVGSWSAENEWANAENNVQEFSRVPISFGIPLSAAPDVRLFSEGIFFTVDSNGVFEVPPDVSPEAEEHFEALCPGSPTSPDAAPGNLCIYIDQADSAGYATLKLATATPAPGTYGWSLPLTLEAESSIEGSWAVTAP
jgi:hypothetical protein